MDDLSDLCSLIERSIDEESPVSVREGGIIRTGFDKTIDNLRSAKTQGKTGWHSWRRMTGQEPGLKT